LPVDKEDSYYKYVLRAKLNKKGNTILNKNGVVVYPSFGVITGGGNLTLIKRK